MRRSNLTRVSGVVLVLSLAATACADNKDEKSDASSAKTSAAEVASSAAGGASSVASSAAAEPASSAAEAPASSPAAAGTGKTDYVVGVSNTLAGNGWREQMICSVKAQALASGKVKKVIAISKNGGPTEQIQDLQNLISQGVNAIIVNPSDREKLNPVIQQATKKGIVVVSVDQAVSEQSAYVATNDQVAYGREGAKWLADKIGGKGSVLYMRGIDGVPADSDRDKGFKEVMSANPNIKVKEVFTGWDFTKGGDIAVQELTSKDYDGVWTSGIDYTVVNAFKTVGKKPVPVVGADTNQFIAQLLEGNPGAAVTNPAVIGGVGTAIALDVLEGKKVERETLLKPDVWDVDADKEMLTKNSFPDRDASYSAAVSVAPYTTYTPEQLFACKGPE